MSTTLDYSSMGLADLLLKQKKIKNKQLLAGFAIGFLLGIAIYSAIRNGFNVIPIFIPFMLIVIIGKNTQKNKLSLEEVKAAIDSFNKV